MRESPKCVENTWNDSRNCRTANFDKAHSEFLSTEKPSRNPKMCAAKPIRDTGTVFPIQIELNSSKFEWNSKQQQRNTKMSDKGTKRQQNSFARILSRIEVNKYRIDENSRMWLAVSSRLFCEWSAMRFWKKKLVCVYVRDDKQRYRLIALIVGTHSTDSDPSHGSKCKRSAELVSVENLDLVFFSRNSRLQ